MPEIDNNCITASHDVDKIQKALLNKMYISNRSKKCLANDD